MRSAHRHSALVVVVVLLFIPAAMALTPASSTTYTITVQEDGSALWQIEYRTLLTTEADLAAFGNYTRDLQSVYLPQMFGPFGYAILSDVRLLPERLVDLYRRLTAASR